MEMQHRIGQKAGSFLRAFAGKVRCLAAKISAEAALTSQALQD